MKKLLAGLCCFFLLVVPCQASSSDELALSAARTFAETVDDGNFQAAYWSGSPLFRLANKEQDWLDQAHRDQVVLGKVITRQLKHIRAVKSPPSLPDDDYRIILFSARAEHKAAAAEVILVHKVDSVWQVCSYTIR